MNYVRLTFINQTCETNQSPWPPLFAAAHDDLPCQPVTIRR